jgi:Transposase
VNEYDGRQFVGIDLHRRRTVIVRQSETGEHLETRRIVNDPAALAREVGKAGVEPEVVLEATYGWYWAADVLAEAGARVHLAHPLGIKGFTYRRVKNDVRDAADLADLLRMGRLPEAWIAPPEVRELRELVRHRAKLVTVRSGFKAGVHAVLAKQGLHLQVKDLFGPAGRSPTPGICWMTWRSLRSPRTKACSAGRLRAGCGQVCPRPRPSTSTSIRKIVAIRTHAAIRNLRGAHAANYAFIAENT